jgi:hypothetical protein
MKALRATAAVLLAVGAQSGCVAVRSSTSPSARLAEYRTFAWYDWPPSATTPQSAFGRTPAGEVVRARIAQELAKKGIHETRKDPDFLVAYHTWVEKKMDVSDWGYPRLFWGAPGPIHTDEYTVGTLFVDFIDRKTGRVFWRGTASAVVDHPENPNLRKLGYTVDQLMKKYPAEVASAGVPPML